MLTPDDKHYINSLNLPEEARTGKGIFPYSYITSQEVLEEERDALPDRDVSFYDTLADSVTVSVMIVPKQSGVFADVDL